MSLCFPRHLKIPCFTPVSLLQCPRATWHAVGECSLHVLGQLANNPIPIHIRFPYEKMNKNCYDFTSVWIIKWWYINMDRPQKHNLRWKRHNVRWKSVRRICIQNKNTYWKFLLFMNTKVWLNEDRKGVNSGEWWSLRRGENGTEKRINKTHIFFY